MNLSRNPHIIKPDGTKYFFNGVTTQLIRVVDNVSVGNVLSFNDKVYTVKLVGDFNNSQIFKESGEKYGMIINNFIIKDDNTFPTLEAFIKDIGLIEKNMLNNKFIRMPHAIAGNNIFLGIMQKDGTFIKDGKVIGLIKKDGKISNPNGGQLTTTGVITDGYTVLKWNANKVISNSKSILSYSQIMNMLPDIISTNVLNYEFKQGVNSLSNTETIEKITFTKDPEKLKNLCDKLPSCIGFNTDGELKKNINVINLQPYTPYNNNKNDGFYYANNIKQFAIQKNVSVDPPVTTPTPVTPPVITPTPVTPPVTTPTPVDPPVTPRPIDPTVKPISIIPSQPVVNSEERMYFILRSIFLFIIVFWFLTILPNTEINLKQRITIALLVVFIYASINAIRLYLYTAKQYMCTYFCKK